MDDVYGSETTNFPHSLRYIHIKAYNVVGILNRIANLMRKKRYNMEEVSVSFDNHGHAHMIIAIDGALIDIEQVMHQIAKLHDVLEVFDVTHKKNRLFTAVYVTSKDVRGFEGFPQKPIKIVENKGNVTGIFSIALSDTPNFIAFLDKKKLDYIRRVMSLI